MTASSGEPETVTHPEEAGRSAPSGRNGGDPLEPGSDVLQAAEPTAVVPDMPHWTDPPTGQVPAVLDRRTDEDDTEAQWSAAGDTGPAWREHSHEWDDSSFDPSLLADDETRVGALEETPARGTPALGVRRPHRGVGRRGQVGGRARHRHRRRELVERGGRSRRAASRPRGPR